MRDFKVDSLLDCLAIPERVGESGLRRETLGKQQHIQNRFPLGDLLHGPIVIKQPRDGSNDIFANRFEQKMNGLADATFVHRSNRHRKGPRVLNHQHGTPVFLGALFEMHLSGVERFSHWNEPFLPDLIVENEVAEPGMFLELEAKQVFRFALVPIGGIDWHADAGHGPGIQGQTQNAVNPAGARIQENVAEVPLVALLDNQAAKRTAGFRKKELA